MECDPQATCSSEGGQAICRCAPGLLGDGSVCLEPVPDGLFFWQADYNQFQPDASVETIARVAARHKIAQFTHGFTVSKGSPWKNGACLDTAFAALPEVIARTRQLNPNIEIFGYVSSTADCAVCSGEAIEEGGQVCECPGGICEDFIAWADLWAGLPAASRVDGIFIDYMKPTIISEATKLNQYAYVRDVLQLKVMANALSSLGGTKFASTGMKAGDTVLSEGFYWAYGDKNTETESIAAYLATGAPRWVALANEKPGTPGSCGERYQQARALALNSGASAFTLQDANLVSPGNAWVTCP